MFAAPWDMNGLIGMPGLLPVLGLGGLFGTSGGIRPGGPNAQLQASFASGAMSKAMSDVDDMSDDDMNDVEDQPTANVPVVSSVACHLAGQQAQSQRLPAIYSTRSMPWTPPAFAPMQPGMGMVHMDFGQQIQPNHLAYGHQDKPNLATPMGGYQGLGPSPEMPLPSTAPPPGMASALGGGLGLGMSPAPGPGNFPSDQPRTCSSNSPFQAYDAHSTGKSSLQLEESSKERRRLQSQDRRQRVMCDIDLCDEPTSELPECITVDGSLGHDRDQAHGGMCFGVRRSHWL